MIHMRTHRENEVERCAAAAKGRVEACQGATYVLSAHVDKLKDVRFLPAEGLDAVIARTSQLHEFVRAFEFYPQELDAVRDVTSRYGLHLASLKDGLSSLDYATIANFGEKLRDLVDYLGSNTSPALGNPFGCLYQSSVRSKLVKLANEGIELMNQSTITNVPDQSLVQFLETSRQRAAIELSNAKTHADTLPDFVIKLNSSNLEDHSVREEVILQKTKHFQPLIEKLEIMEAKGMSLLSEALEEISTLQEWSQDIIQRVQHAISPPSLCGSCSSLTPVPFIAKLEAKVAAIEGLNIDSLKTVIKAILNDLRELNPQLLVAPLATFEENGVSVMIRFLRALKQLETICGDFEQVNMCARVHRIENVHANSVSAILAIQRSLSQLSSQCESIPSLLNDSKHVDQIRSCFLVTPHLEAVSPWKIREILAQLGDAEIPGDLLNNLSIGLTELEGFLEELLNCIPPSDETFELRDLVCDIQANNVQVMNRALLNFHEMGHDESLRTLEGWQQIISVTQPFEQVATAFASLDGALTSLETPETRTVYPGEES